MCPRATTWSGADGIHWDRPNLGLFAFRGNRKNNICYRGVYRRITAKCVNVIKRAPGDYHMLYWDALKPGGPPGIIHHVSKDGVQWRPDRQRAETERLGACHSRRAAMIVCPGGGYEMLADHEGRPVAEWLNDLGRYHHPAPLEDASRAIRWLRSHATELSIDPERIGILGFSAGGHVAASAGTHIDAGNPSSSDPVERVSSRPDFMVLVYAVISFGQYGHVGSCHNLLGENPSEDMIEFMSNEYSVTDQMIRANRR